MGGGVALGILGEVVPFAYPMLTLFQTKDKYVTPPRGSLENPPDFVPT